MLDPDLVAEGARRLDEPPHRDPRIERIAVARIVAGSQGLEGLPTSVEQVLESAHSYERVVFAAAAAS